MKRQSKRISRWLGCSLATCAGAILNLIAAGPALADLVQWKTNGHYYEVVVAPEGITWIEARLAAQARGGYLATLTSRPENLFVWSLISGRPNFWTTSSHAGKTDAVGPWIGLFQVRHQIQEPGGGWGWVSGEPFSYSNWAPGKPNNLEEIEDYGQYFIVHGSNDQATWNDLPNDSLRLRNLWATRPQEGPSLRIARYEQFLGDLRLDRPDFTFTATKIGLFGGIHALNGHTNPPITNCIATCDVP